MNGIVPGPLFLAIVSASSAESRENASLTRRDRSDTVARNNHEDMKRTQSETLVVKSVWGAHRMNGPGAMLIPQRPSRNSP